MTDRERPAVIVLNPLALTSGGVEAGLLAELQGDEPQVPVIILVEDLGELDEAELLEVPFRDFLLKPYTVRELVHRVELALRNGSETQRLRALARDLKGQVSVDFKTGLMSERQFRRVMDAEFARAQRHQLPLSLCLVDVDDFKGINDSTEYAFGDLVLAGVAAVLQANTRESDVPARFGGDEFAVLLPHTTPAESVKTAIRIREKVAAAAMSDARYSRQVTVSIGIDTYDGRLRGSAEDLLRRANRALQDAKRRGKDQVWLFSESATGPSGAGAEADNGV
ncbi:MAG: diguanylate cyclase [Planctomycetota bacterium]